MIKILLNLAMTAAFCRPDISAKPSDTAAAQLNGAAASASTAEIKLPFPAQPARNWAAAAKAAYEKALDEGGLTDFADIKELPPGARRMLEQEWQTLPQGPGNSSEPFKMLVNGRTAFVIQSYIHGDSLRVHIFNAAGVLVARGEGTTEAPLAWRPLP